jgi:SHAQKYF class myb-like DNA-binding protein
MSNSDNQKGEEESESSCDPNPSASPETKSATSLVVTCQDMHVTELESRVLSCNGAGKPHAKHVGLKHLDAAASSQNNCIEDQLNTIIQHQQIEDTSSSSTDTDTSDTITNKANSLGMCGPSPDPLPSHNQVIAETVTANEMKSTAADANEQQEGDMSIDTSLGEHDNDDDGDDVSEVTGASAGDTADNMKGSKRKRSLQLKKEQTNGRWTPEEHKAFLQGLKIFGREWKKVAQRIPTRTSAQIRSHAQKYFAKVERDESISFQDQASSSALMPSSYPSPPFAPVHGHLAPSVQSSVDRILANPQDVQREVEDTLRNLRERYRQLQVRLEETQRHNNGGPLVPRPMGRIVEDSRLQPRPRDRRKQFPEDAVRQQRRYPQQADDSSSSFSSSVSETLSNFSPTRELGNEEWIALHVLGGTLARSASNLDIPVMAESSNDDTNMARSGSASSSLTSEQEESAEGKRNRLAEHGGETSDDNDQMMHD